MFHSNIILHSILIKLFEIKRHLMEGMKPHFDLKMFGLKVLKLSAGES